MSQWNEASKADPSGKQRQGATLGRRAFMAATAMTTAAALGDASAPQNSVRAAAAYNEQFRRKKIALTRTLTRNIPIRELFTTPLDELVPTMLGRLSMAVDDGIISQADAAKIERLGGELIETAQLIYSERETETGPVAGDDGALPSIALIMADVEKGQMDGEFIDISRTIGHLGVIVPWSDLKADGDGLRLSERRKLLDGTYTDSDIPGAPKDAYDRKAGFLHGDQLGNLTIDDLYRIPVRTQPGYRRHMIRLSKQNGLLGNFYGAPGGEDEQTKNNGMICYNNVCVSTSQATYCEMTEDGSACNSLSDHGEP